LFFSSKKGLCIHLFLSTESDYESQDESLMNPLEEDDGNNEECESQDESLINTVGENQQIIADGNNDESEQEESDDESTDEQLTQEMEQEMAKASDDDKGVIYFLLSSFRIDEPPYVIMNHMRLIFSHNVSRFLA